MRRTVVSSFVLYLNLSLARCQVPVAWKMTCLVPVPKMKQVKVMNGLRPIALTSCIMKVSERVVLGHVREQIADYIDPCQFAYGRNRGVEDAILHLEHYLFPP